ncbi:MAG: Gfo/Idh/MocA family oxidoreductase [Planctomycetota bacterium]
MKQQKLRGGMVGGASGSFIGPVHRMAAIMDGQAEYVAGVFSSDPVRSQKTGQDLFLDSERSYHDYRTMLRSEAARPAAERLDFITIVTLNSTHFEIAKACLETGFNVFCEKPMCFNLAQAKALRTIVKKTGKVFALAHTYTGYPMVKQARHIVKTGVLGKINKVVVEYPQGWAAGLLHASAGQISGWRMDPKKAGASCCVGDIGIHAENLVRYITGLQMDAICAELTRFIPSNRLEDDANILVRYKGGAKGILYASEISTGDENGLNIRIYGDKKGLAWNQEDPNYLVIKDPSGFKTIYSKGNPQVLCPAAVKAGRLPFGHPDGLIEAFANLYLEFFKSVRAERAGKKIPAGDFPSVEDGVIGNAFIETAVRSARSNAKWTRMKT